MPSSPSSNLVYQLKVTLKGIKPPIWRRIQVLNNTTLSKLHRILQVVMGWTDSHLHQFIVGRTFYGIPDPDFGMDIRNEKGVKLGQIAAQEKAKFVYEYDFGDSWEHEILVEKILSPGEGVRYPVCVTGKRACPPEDCGGVWGYADLLGAIENPDHPERDEMLEWLGEDFEPEEFDADSINQMLKKMSK